MCLFFQCLLGMECSKFTILAADQKDVNIIVVMKNDVDKLYDINNRIIMGVNGEPSDIAQLANYIEKNLTLYKLKNGYDLDTKAVVHFTRKTLCDSISKQTPYMINSLVGGYSKEKGGQLYFLDAMGSCLPVPFAAHGWAGQFAVSIIADQYRRDLTQEQAYEILRQCVREMQQRCFLNLGSFQVKVVDEHGVSTLPVITETCFF